MNAAGAPIVRQLAVLLLLGACTKKAPKPVRTEPWLAHPPASVAARGPVATRYAIRGPSRIHFELSGERRALRGAFAGVTGEIAVNLQDLAQSRGQVQVDLRSMTLDSEGKAAEHLELLERAERALGDANGANFELRALEDVSPPSLAPGASDGGPVSIRRVRGGAVGNLLLHGFRVVRRAPLEAEFSFDGREQAPSQVVIRSRAPFVIHLETHGISAGGDTAGPNLPPARARDARVSVELYGTKID